MSFRTLIGAILIALLSLVATSAFAEDNKALTKKHQKIIRQFTDVAHISPQELTNMAAEDVIVFDVRERAEYEVSHIEGAVHIQPNISRDAFLEAYGERAKGKTTVFYCSVGQRSSILADKVQADLTGEGSSAVYNLEGGLFKWHNEARPLQSQSVLTNQSTLTTNIHPYNRYWGRMINDRSMARYKSETP